MNPYKLYSVSHLKQIVRVQDGAQGKQYLLRFGLNVVAVVNAYGVTPVHVRHTDEHPDDGRVVGRIAPQLCLHMSKLLFGAGGAQ